jgi:hypothetical protein
MRIVNGQTQHVPTPTKKRFDYIVQDREVRRLMHGRIARRVLPEILKAFQFNVTRIQRFVVGRYSAEDGGKFAGHRDNTTPLTAHRRFAVSVALNEDYEGGLLSFPEYGPRTFKAPMGGAVVFSCSLLHAVSLVTSGRRYVFLPFLFDEAGMELYLKFRPPEERELSEITFVSDIRDPSGLSYLGSASRSSPTAPTRNGKTPLTS